MISIKGRAVRASLFVLAAGLTPIPVAHAQSSGGAITGEQRVRIENHVLAESRPSVAAPPDFRAVAGETLPPGIELFWMSPAVGLNHYRYAVIDGRTVVVVPYTRQIVAVLE
jgi:hypothetical protein